MERDELTSKLFLKLNMIPLMNPRMAQLIFDYSNLSTLKRIEEIIYEYDVYALDIELFNDRLQGIIWSDINGNMHKELIEYNGKLLKHF